MGDCVHGEGVDAAALDQLLGGVEQRLAVACSVTPLDGGAPDQGEGHLAHPPILGGPTFAGQGL
jgi:hypothetical protein